MRGGVTGALVEVALIHTLQGPGRASRVAVRNALAVTDSATTYPARAWVIHMDARQEAATLTPRNAAPPPTWPVNIDQAYTKHITHLGDPHGHQPEGRGGEPRHLPAAVAPQRVARDGRREQRVQQRAAREALGRPHQHRRHAESPSVVQLQVLQG